MVSPCPCRESEFTSLRRRPALAGTRASCARCWRWRSPSGRQPRIHLRWSSCRTPRRPRSRPSGPPSTCAPVAPEEAQRGVTPWHRRTVPPKRSCRRRRRLRSRCRRRHRRRRSALSLRATRRRWHPARRRCCTEMNPPAVTIRSSELRSTDQVLDDGKRLARATVLRCRWSSPSLKLRMWTWQHGGAAPGGRGVSAVDDQCRRCRRFPRGSRTVERDGFFGPRSGVAFVHECRASPGTTCPR